MCCDYLMQIWCLEDELGLTRTQPDARDATAATADGSGGGGGGDEAAATVATVDDDGDAFLSPAGEKTVGHENEGLDDGLLTGRR